MQRRAPQPPHSCRQRAHLPPAAAGEDLGGGEEARGGGYNSHDEDRSGQPVLLQQVQEEADDATDPGHQGAGADSLVPDGGGEELSSVDIDNTPDSAGSEFSQQ